MENRVELQHIFRPQGLPAIDQTSTLVAARSIFTEESIPASVFDCRAVAIQRNGTDWLRPQLEFDPDSASRSEQNLSTMSLQPVNPRPFLQARVGTDVIVRLKWGQTEYKGRLESIDSYMNVLLRDTEEYIDGKPTGTLGLVLIRCVSLG
ncbi:hypothetical protein BDW62DRAFT_176132 [Aspergillus aurantiobrunneus]